MLKVLALLPAVVLATGLTACGSSGGGTAAGGVSLVKQGQLTTCTHLPYQPFQVKQGDQVVGFDVDLIDLVAKKLGVKQNIVDIAFENIQSGESMNAGTCDVAAAGMTITDNRKTKFDFSDPYFDATQVLLVKKGSDIKSLDQLNGKTLGVQSATTGADYAQANAKGAKIVTFDDLALEETAVKSGQIDAGINDNGVLYDYVKANPDTEVGAEFKTNEQYGFGVKKGNSALVSAINDAIKESVKSGDYAKIYQKWFGKAPTWQPGDKSSSTPSS
ncbi:transporter substrate-binding domain-containing protein [Solihabitans fulvus]|uniref:Transporter substrate-binding domain-containing protein n=1 Tax=Solihabitans fulvus TaxID=1892852 RepID=A0A5B2XK68_9PSEU|nr:transporter substrate-binding domain-containing protein [Solihabitans fulvus]KAA2263485.1 transporter substrate-binding domain-containing protein [Solihabitans fulvus]